MADANGESVRAKVIRLTDAELKVGALVYPERSYWRPEVRSDCSNVPRPCPYIGCRHNLYLDVTCYGSFRINFPGSEPWEMRESCALDVADRGDHNLETIGEYMNITRERVRQIEYQAIKKLERKRKIRNEFEREPRTPDPTASTAFDTGT